MLELFCFALNQLYDGRRWFQMTPLGVTVKFFFPPEITGGAFILSRLVATILTTPSVLNSPD